MIHLLAGTFLPRRSRRHLIDLCFNIAYLVCDLPTFCLAGAGLPVVMRRRRIASDNAEFLNEALDPCPSTDKPQTNDRVNKHELLVFTIPES